jgi:hypothetical protein
VVKTGTLSRGTFLKIGKTANPPTNQQGNTHMKNYKVLISEDGESQEWTNVSANNINHLYAILDCEGWDVIDIKE